MPSTPSWTFCRWYGGVYSFGTGPNQVEGEQDCSILPFFAVPRRPWEADGQHVNPCISRKPICFSSDLWHIGGGSLGKLSWCCFLGMFHPQTISIQNYVTLVLQNLHCVGRVLLEPGLYVLWFSSLYDTVFLSSRSPYLVVFCIFWMGASIGGFKSWWKALTAHPQHSQKLSRQPTPVTIRITCLCNMR